MRYLFLLKKGLSSLLALLIFFSSVSPSLLYAETNNGAIVPANISSTKITQTSTSTTATPSVLTAPQRDSRGMWYNPQSKAGAPMTDEEVKNFKPQPITIAIAPPSMSSPGNPTSPGTAYDFSNGTVTFSWSPVSGATKYGVYARDMTTNLLVLDTQTTNSSSYTHTFNYEDGRTYRWNMQSFDSKGVASGFTTPWYFTIYKRLPAPTNLSPGSTSANGPQVNGPQVTLSWSQVTNADSYKIEMTNTSTGSLNTFYPIPTTYTANIVAGQNYKWRIATFSKAGYLSSYSSYYYFQAASTNKSPNTPTISGATTGTTNTPIAINFYTTDPESNQVTYEVNWNANNGSTTSNYGKYTSGQTAEIKNTYATAGTYCIKARAFDTSNAYSGSTSCYSVTISAPTIPSPTLSVTPTTQTITAGQSAKETITTTNVKSCVLSDNTTITNNGDFYVTPSTTTTYTVTCTGNNSTTISKSFTITVVPAFTVSPSSLSLDVNATKTATVSGGVQPYSVTSSNTSIATAVLGTDGKTISVTGKSAGTTTITVKDTQNRTATISITVTNPDTPTLTNIHYYKWASVIDSLSYTVTGSYSETGLEYTGSDNIVYREKFPTTPTNKYYGIVQNITVKIQPYVIDNNGNYITPNPGNPPYITTIPSANLTNTSGVSATVLPPPSNIPKISATSGKSVSVKIRASSPPLLDNPNIYPNNYSTLLVPLNYAFSSTIYSGSQIVQSYGDTAASPLVSQTATTANWKPTKTGIYGFTIYDNTAKQNIDHYFYIYSFTPLVISPPSVSIEPSKSTTVTVSGGIQGTYAISGGDTNIASATLVGNQVTVTGKALGTTEFTLKDATYSGLSELQAKLTVTVNDPSSPPTLTKIHYYKWTSGGDNVAYTITGSYAETGIEYTENNVVYREKFTNKSSHRYSGLILNITAKIQPYVIDNNGNYITPNPGNPGYITKISSLTTQGTDTIAAIPAPLNSSISIQPIPGSTLNTKISASAPPLQDNPNIYQDRTVAFTASATNYTFNSTIFAGSQIVLAQGDAASSPFVSQTSTTANWKTTKAGVYTYTIYDDATKQNIDCYFTIYSFTPIVINPPIVPIEPSQTFTVTLSGGIQNTYVISGGNSAIATATLTGNQIAIKGISTGVTEYLIKDATNQNYSLLQAKLTIRVGSPLIVTPTTLSLEANTTQTAIITSGNGGYSVTSSNTSIATASLGADNKTITVTGKSAGSATVTVKDVQGRTADVAVSVAKPIVDLIISPTTLAVNVGSTGTATIKSGNDGYKVTSSDTSIATANLSSDNKTITITGKSSGSTTAIVKDAQGKSATINISVANPIVLTPSSVTIEASGHRNADIVTVSGGDGTKYTISGGSESTAMAEIIGDKISLTGYKEGTEMFRVSQDGGVATTVLVVTINPTAKIVSVDANQDLVDYGLTTLYFKASGKYGSVGIEYIEEGKIKKEYLDTRGDGIYAVAVFDLNATNLTPFVIDDYGQIFRSGKLYTTKNNTNGPYARSVNGEKLNIDILGKDQIVDLRLSGYVPNYIKRDTSYWSDLSTNVEKLITNKDSIYVLINFVWFNILHDGYTTSVPSWDGDPGFDLGDFGDGFLDSIMIDFGEELKNFGVGLVSGLGFNTIVNFVGPFVAKKMGASAAAKILAKFVPGLGWTIILGTAIYFVYDNKELIAECSAFNTDAYFYDTNTEENRSGSYFCGKLASKLIMTIAGFVAGAKVDLAKIKLGKAAARAANFKPKILENFSENLNMRLPKPAKGFQAHHMLPQKFEEKFSQVGLNIHDPDFGSWWRGSPTGTHQNLSNEYNEVWQGFFDKSVADGVQLTQDMILAQMKTMHEYYKQFYELIK